MSVIEQLGPAIKTEKIPTRVENFRSSPSLELASFLPRNPRKELARSKERSVRGGGGGGGGVGGGGRGCGKS